jgi:hypothetical protein
MGATKSLLSHHHYIPCTSTGIKSSVEGPADTDEAPIPTEPESMNLSGTTTTLKRKAAKRTCVTKLTAANIKSSPEEDIPARKKPRLQVQASLPAIVAADADTLNVPPDAIVAAPVASSDAASPMKPNGGAARAPHRWWTPEEDKKLASAVKTTRKKKHGKKYKIDWIAVSPLVPGRTKRQCFNRWHDVLQSKKNGTTARAGNWTKEEDSTLKDAVKKHNCKNWGAITALVPGRTIRQCNKRWHGVLECNSDEAIARVGKWTTYEDSSLKDAVEKHNGKDWAAIAALVPGRTKRQCNKRWHDALDSKSDETTALKGTFSKDEDVKLKDAVKKHNGKDWTAISTLVPGRTKQQCLSRWHYVLDSKKIRKSTK